MYFRHTYSVFFDSKKWIALLQYSWTEFAQVKFFIIMSSQNKKYLFLKKLTIRSPSAWGWRAEHGFSSTFIFFFVWILGFHEQKNCSSYYLQKENSTQESSPMW